MNWSTETAAAAVKGQKRGILTEKNVLIFSIFESKWGSGRKYLKNERAASPSPKSRPTRKTHRPPQPPPPPPPGRGGMCLAE